MKGFSHLLEVSKFTDFESFIRLPIAIFMYSSVHNCSVYSTVSPNILETFEVCMYEYAFLQNLVLKE